MTDKKRVAVYYKASGPEQWSIGKSSGVQIARCQQWADANGMSIVGTLSNSERPAIEVLKEAIRSGDYEALIAYKPETYDRDFNRLTDLIAFARERGVRIYEAKHGVELTSDLSFLQSQQLPNFAPLETLRRRAEFEELARCGKVLVEMELPKELLDAIPGALKELGDGPATEVLQAVLDGVVTPDEV
ncbi:recombinase family protein [Streptomyces sp. UNOC14_S4]|uniref:recombinase family protein n=1 Tax=Streptomyces sp. UNOC14_S4 TaxID=2872340 RepID=UPI001E4DAFF1|nr:recombinase family protein [Streptomyces sp. UNOC14_S4]MCC3766498.1 recombinase family protein [Streptomyces sp. UNOC14_S4]